MNDILAVRGQAIKLGFQGENNAKRIIFDLSEFIEEYGPGTATVFYQQQRDPAPYPVITEQEGNKLYWTVKDTETHIKGYGLAQLVYTVGDTVAKTCLFETHILRSLSEPTDPPEGYESWINNLLEKASDLEDKIGIATELVEEVQGEIEEARELLDEIKTDITSIKEDVEKAESAAETATAAANSAENYAQNASDSADRAEAAAESVKANHIRLYSNGTVIFNQDRTAPITFEELHELVSDTSKMVTIDNQGTQIFYLGTIFDDSVEFFETYIFEGETTAARMIMNAEGRLKWDEIALADKQYVKDYVDEHGGGGTTDYSQLTNKPKINGVELTGNKTAAELGINVPTSLSQLSGDSTHRVVTDAEKTSWNNKSDFSGDYNDLKGKPTIPTVPENVSAFVNDAEYLTMDTLPIYDGGVI